MVVESFDTAGSTFRSRNMRLRQLVSQHCIDANDSIDTDRLQGSLYIRYLRHPLSAIGAGLVILATLPVFIIIALLIKLDSSGPVFFVQERTGLYGRRFKMFKFRTMVKNAVELKAQLKAQNIFGPDSPDFKLKKDPRITRIGGFLRKTSLDELPNLFNVLLGDMALVGPRPTSFPIETYRECNFPRLAISPGITGIWQISGRADIDFEERTRLDVKYINSASFWTDSKIIVKTIVAVFQARGAY